MSGTASRVSRRIFLGSALAAFDAVEAHQAGAVLPSEARRYEDPTTEIEVVRLTDPAYACTLPAYYNRAVTRNSASLLFASDREGQAQAFRMELKTGESHQLTDLAELDASSLALTPDSRSFCCFAGRTLVHVSLGNPRHREIYHIPDGWERSSGMSLAPDGAHALFAEARGESSRLRSVSLVEGAARTVLDGHFPIEHAIARPGHGQIVYAQGAESLWMVDGGGANNRRLKLAAGRVGSAQWSADGKALQYLSFPQDTAQLHAIREYSPDAATDRLVAKTSQFACCSANRDSSVFVGASANRSSPTVLLLLRITRREFTLCEHKASNPETVTPIFSPDSRRVIFQSDRDGRRAIYTVHVDKLVEPTEADTGC